MQDAFVSTETISIIRHSTKLPSCYAIAAAVQDKKRFEVKKWNAVALWAWDIVVDNCAICR